MNYVFVTNNVSEGHPGLFHYLNLGQYAQVIQVMKDGSTLVQGNCEDEERLQYLHPEHYIPIEVSLPNYISVYNIAGGL